MERTIHIDPVKNPNLILTGDWHLRENIPECRMDNFWETQWKKVDFIAKLQYTYNCPIVHSGDLFNSWKPSPYLLASTIAHMPKQFYTVYGNHDLPQHSLELSNKCGIEVLKQSGHLTVLDGVHWKKEPGEITYDLGLKRKVLFWHVMTYTGGTPWPGCIDLRADEVLQKYNGYDLIVTGHNHKPFTAQWEGRLLVNPGSITRQKADQMNAQPCVYLWYEETNTVKPVYLPIDDNVVSKEHIKRKETHDERLYTFVQKLNGDWGGVIILEEHLRRLLLENEVRKEVEEIAYKAIEIEKV